MIGCIDILPGSVSTCCLVLAALDLFLLELIAPTSVVSAIFSDAVMMALLSNASGGKLLNSGLGQLGKSHQR